MSFYTKLFNKLTLRPSTKFYYNIFLLKQSLSFLFTHNLFTHIFLSTKTLKIKFFKIKNNFKLIKYTNVFFLLLLVFLLTML